MLSLVTKLKYTYLKALSHRFIFVQILLSIKFICLCLRKLHNNMCEKTYVYKNLYNTDILVPKHYTGEFQNYQ